MRKVGEEEENEGVELVTKVRWEGQVRVLDWKVSKIVRSEGQMGGLGSKVSYDGQVGELGRTLSACE